MAESISCGICGGPTISISEPNQGYVEGYYFEILECSRCSGRMSSNQFIPAWLYDRIYEQSSQIPGYARYSRYSHRVKEHDAPLDFMAESELAYRYVADFMRRDTKGSGLIVEIGCGSGYLTYALRKTGYECIGVDNSSKAIALARDVFGEPSWFSTTEDFQSEGRLAHLVIALEVIEHVASPYEFVNEAFSLLEDGGAMLLTTPNRNASPKTALWASDLPPVHLYWLGQESLEALAGRCGADVEILIPSAMGNGELLAQSPLVWPPILDASGDVTAVVRQDSRFSSRLRKRLARALTTLTIILSQEPRRELTNRKGATEAVPTTLGSVFRKVSL